MIDADETQYALIAAYSTIEDLRRRNAEMVGVLTDEQLQSITSQGPVRSHLLFNLFPMLTDWYRGKAEHQDLRDAIEAAETHISKWQTLRAEQSDRASARWEKAKDSGHTGAGFRS